MLHITTIGEDVKKREPSHTAGGNVNCCGHFRKQHGSGEDAKSGLTLDAMDCSPAGLLCPWDFPGKNNGVGSHFLLQGIFPTLHLLHWKVDSLPLNHLESPREGRRKDK